MDRVNLDDGTWFDADKAEMWNDPNGFILAIDGLGGSYTLDFYTIWCTEKGEYVVDDQNGHCVISGRDAARAMIKNGMDLPDHLKPHLDELER